MTTPVSAGYPDYIRQQSEAQVLEVNDKLITFTGTNTYPVKYIGNAKALFLWAATYTTRMRVQILYLSDAAGTDLLDFINCDCWVGDTIRQPIPILGPYMQAQAIPDTGGQNQYTLRLWRTPALTTVPSADLSQQMISQYQLGIAATTTLTFDSVDVFHGPAVWTALCTGGNWAAVVQGRDYLGTTFVIDRLDGSGPSEDWREIWLPPAHVQVTMTNSNAAAQTYRVMMSRKFL